MLCCLNPDCLKPLNPDGVNYCQTCGTKIVSLLRGHYRIIEPIGRGGFGKTYLAEDLDKLNQRCVVKQLAPKAQETWALNKAVQLFEQEARQLQELGEENSQIPTLYAYFEEDGYLYLVQQFIDGQNLAKELEKRVNWSESEIRGLLLSLLPVLQFIHDRGVIHRDIKPENIMRRTSPKSASYQGTSEQLVLIDFGVSKQLSGTVKATTVTGTAIGSGGYAPLEQIQAGEAYPASDLFSLGTTCFYLLTKVHPLELWREHGYSWTKNWRQHLKHPISKQLRKVLNKLLQKDLEKRYQSAEAVLSDLQVQLPPSPLPRHNKTFKKPLMAGTAILLLGLASYAGVKIVSSIVSSLTSQVSTDREQVSSNQEPVSPDEEQVSWETATSIAKLTGNLGWVNSVIFSPDGKTLASADLDTMIAIWNLETKKAIATLKGHSKWVVSIAFSPDGKTLVSGSEDKTIKLWNLETKKAMATLRGHSDAVITVAFSPDGKSLASGSADRTIKLWNLDSKQELATLRGHSEAIGSVAFSRDGRTLASGSADRTIKLWNLDSKQELATLRGHSESVYGIAFSRDGQTLASGSGDKTIQLWDLDTKQAIATLEGHLEPIAAVAFSPDGRTLASASADKTIKLWNLNTKVAIATLRGHSESVYAIAFSPDGTLLASGSRDKTIQIWQAESR
jgi:WD40 repeat protein/tRNA A-37 threonylcarbamoyl transferase component Bud32